MKKKIFILVSLLLATCISIISPSQANAGDCSPENPCGTWAVVDNSGTVTNIIVCQASVCGGGEFAGQKVIEQIAPDPITSQSQGGWNSSEKHSVVVSDGIFTVTQSNEDKTSSSFSFSEPQKETNGSYSSVAASFCSEFKLKEGDCARITVTNQSINGTIVESDTVDPTTMTESEIRQQFIDNAKVLLVEKIQLISKTVAKLMKTIATL
jgi:hypothetical protein